MIKEDGSGFGQGVKVSGFFHRDGRPVDSGGRAGSAFGAQTSSLDERPRALDGQQGERPGTRTSGFFHRQTGEPARVGQPLEPIALGKRIRAKSTGLLSPPDLFGESPDKA
jgi:hypothetical protein